MTVVIPAALWNYTKNHAETELTAATVREALASLEGQFPGIRHRIIDEQDQIRPHIKFFVNRDQCRSLDTSLDHQDVVTIVCALSGG